MFFDLSVLQKLVLRRLISQPNSIINVCRCEYVFSRLCCVKLGRFFSLEPSTLVNYVAVDFLKLKSDLTLGRCTACPFLLYNLFC